MKERLGRLEAQFFAHAQSRKMRTVRRGDLSGSMLRLTGPNGALGRISERDVVLVRDLRAALERLNLDLPARRASRRSRSTSNLDSWWQAMSRKQFEKEHPTLGQVAGSVAEA